MYSVGRVASFRRMSNVVKAERCCFADYRDKLRHEEIFVHTDLSFEEIEQRKMWHVFNSTNGRLGGILSFGTSFLIELSRPLVIGH